MRTGIHCRATTKGARVELTSGGHAFPTWGNSQVTRREIPWLKIYLDNDNGLPEWAAVKSGMFGNHETLVPLAEAQADNDGLSVPYSKDAIKSAPHWDPSQELSIDDEKQLFDHYGVSYSGATVTAEELAAHCGQRLATYKVPAEFRFTDALPVNASGKILKRELRTRD